MRRAFHIPEQGPMKLFLQALPSISGKQHSRKEHGGLGTAQSSSGLVWQMMQLSVPTPLLSEA